MPMNVLRCGIDSLYVSYDGKLSDEWAQRLALAKLTARAEDDTDRAQAQVKLGEHLFEVSDRGKGKYPYVLRDNWFHISVAGVSATHLPLAYAQISSDLLTAVGVPAALCALRFVVGTLGLVRDPERVSRADLFVDFTTSEAISSLSTDAWVTRAHKIASYTTRQRFSGWTVGIGGEVGARLYDKTLELERSRKDYLMPLWRAAGWQEPESVWRLEFEFKRAALVELGVRCVADLFECQGGLWRYATGDWLRLTIPDVQDSNRARWPVHPLWEALAQVDWRDANQPALVRARTARPPAEETLALGAGYITSFMAARGITDLAEGIGEYLAFLQRFYNHRERRRGKDFADYMGEKVLAKGRRFNTLDNLPTDESVARRAEEYRKASAYPGFSSGPNPDDESQE